ncbi:MAG: hypothetical protein V7703_21505 [Hyphomicrobiales bacterium]
MSELILTRVELKGRLLAKQVDSHLKQNDLAMMAVGDFLSANPDISPAIAQSRMRRYVRAAAGLRAILAVNANGELAHDSYSLPGLGLDLEDRLYLQDALKLENSDLQISAPVIGRKTGLPFIPITRSLFNVENKPTGVIVGILGPETLLPDDSDCASCISAVLTTDLDILVSRPTGLQFSDDLLNHIQESLSATGLKLVEKKGGKMLVTWTRSSAAGVVTIAGELLSD